MELTKLKVVDPFKATTLVDKDNLLGNLHHEMEVTTPVGFEGVDRDVVPVDLSGLKELRFTKVQPGTLIPAHAHKSPVFRLITDGEAIVNGKSYKEGDWMIIPPGMKYEIKSGPSGYKADWICAVCW